MGEKRGVTHKKEGVPEGGGGRRRGHGGGKMDKKQVC